MIDKIVLIGYRATGKSTIGRALASKLSFSFLDTDSLIRSKCNSSIEEIVGSQGWDAFRKYEAEALIKAFESSNTVVATGGGAIMHRDIWAQYGRKALVVWLTADLSVLAGRLGGNDAGNSERPTLTGKAIDQEIADILEVRTPIYRELSDYAVDTGRMSIAVAVDSITEKFHSIAVGE
ncbi:shikimate kinase [Desulfosediminicola ganghwensis]|uniref:shikimate kinase n=1 Tax=Desulfosediminicola ganghwensis TaxID=2569540 RepID=UPI0010AD8614|nr:shikimate kinase [Desulfosediminicola ganghwensis]